MNVYPELIAGDGGTPSEEWVLVRTPGLKLLQTLGDTPNRGIFSTAGRCFVVAGGSFYEVTGLATATLRGSLITSTALPVLMRSNSVEVMVLADGFGYIFNLATNVFTQITDPDFPSDGFADGLAMIDTYFIVSAKQTNKFWISSPLAGLNWAALDFGSSQEADLVQGLADLHLYLWIFGRERIVIFQNTGAPTFPFQRLPGGEIEMGLAAPSSLAVLDNTLFWIGSNRNGPAIVYRADGFLPSRISNHALEYAMQSYGTLAAAVASTYQEEGHPFYRLDFPTANAGRGATWVYDVSTKRWHNRGRWDSTISDYRAHLARFHAYAFDTHLVLDYLTGKIYDQSLNYADDAGAVLRWVRRAPHIDEGRVRIFYRALQIVMQMGGALVATYQIMLRWSDDGGMTWSSEHWRSIPSGAPGDYRRRLLFRRLGVSRLRVFELSGSDPVPRLVIAGVDLEIEKGTS